MSEGETKRPKTVEELKHILTRFIGNGSFNCVYLTNTNQVLRVAAYDKTHGLLNSSKSKIRRGIVLAHLLTNIEALGPCRVQSVSYDFMSEVQFKRHVKEVEIVEMNESGENKSKFAICGPIKKTFANVEIENREFAVNLIEYIAGGDLHTVPIITDVEFTFSCFALIWFFYVGQAELGLHHGDLKGGNVMMRIYNQARNFEFKLVGDDDCFFQFSSRVCPVVIDYDFGFIETSHSESKNFRVSTLSYTTPEGLMYEILLSHVKGGTKKKIAEAAKEKLKKFAHTRDWWSIGLCILDLFVAQLGGGESEDIYVPKLAYYECRAYADYMYDRVASYAPITFTTPKENFLNIGRALTFCAVITALINNDDSMIVPKYSFFGDGFGLNVLFNHKEGLLAITQTPSYLKLKRLLRDHMPVHLRFILCDMLSWMPQQRNCEGKPFIHLYSTFFKRFQTSQQESRYVTQYAKRETISERIETLRNHNTEENRLKETLSNFDIEEYPDIA